VSTTPEIAAALVASRYGRARPASDRIGKVRGEMLPTPADPPPPPPPEPRTSPPPLPRQKSVESLTMTLRPGSFAKSL